MKRKIGELILIIFFYLCGHTLGRVIAIGGIKTESADYSSGIIRFPSWKK